MRPLLSDKCLSVKTQSDVDVQMSQTAIYCSPYSRQLSVCNSCDRVDKFGTVLPEPQKTYSGFHKLSSFLTPHQTTFCYVFVLLLICSGKTLSPFCLWIPGIDKKHLQCWLILQELSGKANSCSPNHDSCQEFYTSISFSLSLVRTAMASLRSISLSILARCPTVHSGCLLVAPSSTAFRGLLLSFIE